MSALANKVPIAWPRVALADLIVEAQAGFASGERATDGVIQLRMNNVDTEGRIVWDSLLRVPAAEGLVCEYCLKPGDVLFNNTNSTELVGKSALFHQHDEPVVYSNHFTRIRPVRDKLMPTYLAFWLNHEWRCGTFADICNRWIGQSAVKAGRLLALEIPLPPLSEQERIARRLTQQMAGVQRARAAAAERLAAAQALPAAYLREMFGDTAPFSASVVRPTEPSRAGWRWHLLSDLSRLATGHTPSRRESKWWGGEIHWLQLPDIRAVDGLRVMETSEQTNELGLANSAAVLLPAGTVCMSRTASVGFVTIMGRDMATSQDFVNWVCGPDLDPDFLMYLILRSRREIRDLGSGATHHTIYFETVENFSICAPPLAEQKRIAAGLSQRLAEAERLAATLREELAAIDALPSALLRAAFGAGGADE